MEMLTNNQLRVAADRVAPNLAELDLVSYQVGNNYGQVRRERGDTPLTPKGLEGAARPADVYHAAIYKRD